MGRKRKTDQHLAQRLYLRSGSYYFVDYKGKWNNLGRSYSVALAGYTQLTDSDKPCRTISDLIDRYLKEVAPAKAPTTYEDNIKQGKFLRAALGHILPEKLTAKLVYQYMDERGKSSKNIREPDTSKIGNMSLLENMQVH